MSYYVDSLIYVPIEMVFSNKEDRKRSDLTMRITDLKHTPLLIKPGDTVIAIAKLISIRCDNYDIESIIYVYSHGFGSTTINRAPAPFNSHWKTLEVKVSGEISKIIDPTKCENYEKPTDKKLSVRLENPALIE